MQHSLGWETPEVRRHLSTATIMYKGVQNRTQLTFSTRVVLLIEAPMLISFPFFHLLSPFIWNDLPNSAVHAESVTGFQTYALPIIRLS